MTVYITVYTLEYGPHQAMKGDHKPPLLPEGGREVFRLSMRGIRSDNKFLPSLKEAVREEAKRHGITHLVGLKAIKFCSSTPKNPGA